MQLPADTSLAGQIAELRRRIDDVQRSGGRVYDPETGASVPLSTLAFGRDASSHPGTVSLATNDTLWTADPNDLAAWAFVSAGRLLVTVAAKLVVAGNKATMSMSWDVYGPTMERGSTTSADTGPAASTVAGPSVDRALSVLMDDAGQSQSLSAAYTYEHTDLDPGWYRVRPRYNLIGAAGQPTGISGSATSRTVIADPR